jgi:hypothetical protein
MADRDTPRIIEVSEEDISGLKKSWRIFRLLAELDSHGMAQRELGYDTLGRVVHRWPGGESLASHGILDLAVFADSSQPGMSATEFERLWRKAIEEEEFFAENDSFGDRFGTSIPWWGCAGALAVLAAAAYFFIR